MFSASPTSAKRLMITEGSSKEMIVLAGEREQSPALQPVTRLTGMNHDSFVTPLPSLPRCLRHGIYFQTSLDEKELPVTHLTWRGNLTQPVRVKEFLQHGMAFVIHDKMNDGFTIACASLDKTRIYKYQIKPEVGDTLLPKGPLPHYALQETAGLCIFECKEDTLADITVVKDHKQNYHALYFESGKILVGTFANNRFEKHTELAGSKPSGVSELYFSGCTERRLINIVNGAYLHWWGLDSGASGLLKLPSLFYMKMSASGRYLTGLIDQGHNQSNSFCVIDLAKEFKIHEIKLNSMLQDIYIGTADQFYELQNDEIITSGSINQFLTRHFEHERDRAERSLALLTPPAKPKSKSGFFSWFKSREVSRESPKEVPREVQRNPSPHYNHQLWGNIPRESIPNPFYRRPVGRNV